MPHSPPQFPRDPRAFLPPFPGMTSVDWPVLTLTRQRNTALDQLFYDVGALSAAERAVLVGETNLEGAILVVYPRGARGDLSLVNHADYETLRAAPGRLLRYFSIAGVGSSDLGAAALARNLADHVQEPVGAIVAGYGIADLLAEGLGGWFFLGANNQLLQYLHQWRAASAALPTPSAGSRTPTPTEAMAPGLVGRSDADTLLRLLRDEERDIQMLLGHSKGCLSIATALEALAVGGPAAARRKATAIRVITTGAVVEFPAGFDHVIQFLGELDGFGALNSRLQKDFVKIPGAWHHVNTAIPFHLSIRDVLTRASGHG